jgi:hypothetical protein
VVVVGIGLSALATAASARVHSAAGR